MLSWLILSIAFFHASDQSMLRNSNLLRVINFTGTMFFGMALVSDLYKWSTFLVATGAHHATKDYKRNMFLSKVGVILVQTLNLCSTLGIDIWLMVTDQQPNLRDQVTEYGNSVEETCFLFTASLFMVLAIALTIVDVKLLMRLKKFYPAFYQSEKCKVRSLTHLLLDCDCQR